MLLGESGFSNFSNFFFAFSTLNEFPSLLSFKISSLIAVICLDRFLPLNKNDPFLESSLKYDLT